MLTTIRNAVIILLLTAAAVTSWFYSRPEAETERAVEPQAGPPLGYYMTGATIHMSDMEGLIPYTLDAELFAESPDQKQLEIEGITFRYETTGEPPWIISARSATGPTDGSSLLFSDFELRHSRAGNEPPLVVRGSRLEFDRAQGLATSSEPVAMALDNGTLWAGSVRADLKEGRLRLESGIDVRYAP